MSYPYLDSLQKFGINLGLERITYLLEKLGNPHLKFKSIHVAGTNGKGSTCAMTASILKEAGYKVGLYTSPHLFDYTERIKINGKDISRQELKEGIRRIKKEAEAIRRDNKEIGQPTIFEVLTAVAFWYFAKKKMDYVVAEVGLGGRLDATNVLTPQVSVITNIDLEHTEVLGKTLKKIAGEKAAIIKPGISVVTAEMKKEALAVITQRAKKNRSLLIGVIDEQEAMKRNLLGEHQKLNAACAIAAVRLSGAKVTKTQVKKGLQKAEWPGRFQIVSKKPLVIVDGAHNPAGAKVFAGTVKKLYPKKKFVLLYGCIKAKDYLKSLAELKPFVETLILTKFNHPDSVDAEEIADNIEALWQGPIVTTDSAEHALGLWDGKYPLLITGSLFLVADALEYLNERKT